MERLKIEAELAANQQKQLQKEIKRKKKAEEQEKQRQEHEYLKQKQEELETLRQTLLLEQQRIIDQRLSEERKQALAEQEQLKAI